MAITSGSVVLESGTQATVISDTSTIADAAFNGATITALTPSDVVPFGDAVLTVTMSTAPSAGAAFHLYRRDLNIDGTNDATVPDANYKNIYLGSFPIDLVTTIQYVSLPGIPLAPDQEFYLENDTGQTTTSSTTTIVKITPRSYNVKA